MSTERTPSPTYASFAGDRQLARGGLQEVLLQTKAQLDAHGEREPILFFQDDTGKQLDFDLRGTPAEVLARALPAPPPPAGPGRPKLGVVAREVTLLPRHWEWLEAQPSGLSATLRRLVDDARKQAPQQETARLAIEAASRVMTALAGNRPGYEEASRALFARDRTGFEALVKAWPPPVGLYLQHLLQGALDTPVPGRQSRAS